MNECRGIAAVVRLTEPARSWWPQIGCTPLQTIAAAALATIARVHSARKKITELGGIPALVQLIVKGTAEAQGHAARSLGLLAENRNFAYEVFAICRRGCTAAMCHGFDCAVIWESVLSFPDATSSPS